MILSFGEIDIRVHCIKQALLAQISVRESTLRIASRYMEVLQQISEFGYKIAVIGIHASSIYTTRDFPAYGPMTERNRAAKVFNEAVAQWCNDNLHPFFTLSSLAMDDNYEYNPSIMSDCCHLDQNPILQAIMLHGLYSSVIRNKQKWTSLPECETSRTGSGHHEYDHALGQRFFLSSSLGNNPINGLVSNDKPYFFHTNHGRDEWIEISWDI